MNRLLKLFALFFAAGGLTHAAALFHPPLLEPSPVWRHALFVAINSAAAAGLWSYRPRFFPFFAVLAAQQFYSHSVQAADVWRSRHQVDWPSILVLLFMPVLLLCLWALAKGSFARHEAQAS